MPDTRRPLRFGGHEVHQLIASRSHLLARTIVARLGDLVPAYGTLPLEQLKREFTTTVETALRVFVEVVRTGDLPETDALAPLAQAAGRRAEEGLPLADVLTAYHWGISLVLEDVTRGATPEDLEDLQALHRLLLVFLARVTAAAASGYIASSQQTLRETQDAKQALFDALVEGDDAEAVASRVGLSLPPRFCVLVMSVGSHQDEKDPRVDHVVAARRKLRRINHDLDVILPEALSSITAESGTILVPADQGGGFPDTAELVRQLSRAAGAPVLAAAEEAEPAVVGHAVATCRDVLAVARNTGLIEGVVFLDDVLIPFQLSRPSAARARLASLLEPLRDHPDILETLRGFMLVDGMNRRRTAKRLGVHPNTVDYRLKRVATITGLDPSDSRDVQKILGALLTTPS